MASKQELQALIVLAGKTDPSLRKALDHAVKQTKTLDKATRLFQETAERTWSKVRSLVGIAAIGAGLGYIGKMGIQLASDLTEVQNVIDVTFGERAETINTWAQNAKRDFGLSELAAKRFVGSMGAMLKSLGVADDYIATMSTTLSSLAADFASFYNLEHEEAFSKIMSGMSGQVSPLQSLGINMSVANLEAYALAQGINKAWSEMSSAEQAILRYNYLLTVSADAHNDFSRNIGTFANQTRIFDTNLKDLFSTIMSGVIPSLELALAKANDFLEKLMSDPKQIEAIQQGLAKAFNKAADLIPTAISLAGKFVISLGNIITFADRIARFVGKNWAIIKPTIIGIVGAMILWKTVTTGMKVIENVSKMVKGLKSVISLLTVAKLKDAAITAYLRWLYIKDAIAKGASAAATTTWTAVTKAARVATLAAAAAQWALNSAILANPMTWIIAGIVAAIGALVAGFIALYRNWDTVQNFLVNTWTRIKLAFFNGVNWVIDKINWLIEKINKLPFVEIPLIPKIDTSKYDVAEKQVDQIATAQKLEGYARGGLTTKPAIFGEDGPEMAIPIKRTPRSIGLLNKTAQMLGVDSPAGGKGATFVFAPNIYGGNAAEIERSLRSVADDMFAMFEKWWEERRREDLT